MKKYTLIATCPMGFESVIKTELRTLNIPNPRLSDGAVEFDTDAFGLAMVNMGLRSADRILLKIASFKATDFDQLYDQTEALPWSDFIPADAKFPVTKVSSVKSKLFAKSACQGMVKKAVAEALLRQHKVTRLPETGVYIGIRLAIRKDWVTLSLDTSGEGLHKRGYRSSSLKAPMRETLAATLVGLCRWYPDKGVLFDPMCGSGTIAIEAALMARQIAPNKNRSFECQKWPIMTGESWEEAKTFLEGRERNIPSLRIFASDVREHVVKQAIENAKNAGVNDIIHFKTADSAKVDIKDKIEASEFDGRQYAGAESGYILFNPPYGERMDEKDEVRDLLIGSGKNFFSHYPGWSVNLITPDKEIQDLWGRKSTKNRKLFHGGMECHFHQFT